MRNGTGKKLEDGQMAKLLENIRNMVASDVGPFIYEYFKNQLLKRGLVIMRESLRDREGLELLIALGELWRNFFRQILPTLEILLRPIQTTEFSIRQVSLLTFRDVIVLKFFSELTGVLKNTATVSPPIRQMFLILQGINEGFPPTENRLQLECLVGLAVNPYIGFKGIYFGSSEPAIEATEEAYRKKSSITKPPFLPFQSRQLSIDVQRLPENNVWGLYKRYGHVRQASIPDVKLHLRLHELKQDDAPRRYSYDDYAKT
ncbi:proline-rich protein 5-like isoform X2 [Tubulanus polymorphus]|uniref:proline-rich protein 5-like isoform X2 n=1 Tax=Tubulanus polymorphus TaxID=672921 RepID=UPI003DA5BE6A